MIAALVVFAYLALVLYVGIFAFRRGTSKAEDFFVANRSLGTFVFLLSLFGSNMTSFAILGSSGLAFRMGIGVYGLMASISGIVIPLSIFIIGTRIWALGKKYGHMTQVQIFRDRWEMGHIGTVIFALQAVMLVPYIIIGVMGGGETLDGVSKGAVPYWLGGLVVALVVMCYVFFGGMRGTAWVNTLQTLMFLVFGTIAFIVIARQMPGGFAESANNLANSLDPKITGPNPAQQGQLLTRHRIPEGYYLSYMFIPLSSIMFPHIAIFCLTARRMASFRKTVIFYPLCIMAIWLPAVFLGAIGSTQWRVVATTAAGSAEFHAWLNAADRSPRPDEPAVVKEMRLSADPASRKFLEVSRTTPGPIPHEQAGQILGDVRDGKVRAELRKLASTNADGIMLDMLGIYSPVWLAGILGAAIMACVMASDSQILALSTMWAEDVYRFYGGKSEAKQVWSARVFVIVLTIAAYIIALTVHEYANIFELAIQYAFSGYASMAPIMLACLFWKRSTKWGALAATLWVAGCLIASTVIQARTAYTGPPGGATPIWKIGDTVILNRETVRLSFTEYRLLIVVPMFIGSALCMWLFSILTPPPSRRAIEKYFPSRGAADAADASGAPGTPGTPGPAPAPAPAA